MASTSYSRRPSRGSLADYAPNTPPYVPRLIFACINQVELRGLGKMFLYTRNHNFNKAKALVLSFCMRRRIPDLRRVDIHTVTLTLKIFLFSLSEPLITDELRDSLVGGSRIADKITRDATLIETIKLLPNPNFQTLRYILIHLRFVTSTIPGCSFDTLAFVFGPIVVGGSSEYPTASASSIREEDQIQVFRSLLEMNPY
ncbi:rac GTPase-activating protein 1-like [Venturia canescens]|uniref:rac GTPase-activating protein 1-like n=1 Tax=Venturia canescens TaxID=32260 RepID=UPI001C9CBC82|nr:rac GTPase-activating protein 1-like [Venturia canescens]